MREEAIPDEPSSRKKKSRPARSWASRWRKRWRHLVLEACDEKLGIQTKMLLRPARKPVHRASVDNEDKSWLRRFHAQLEKHPDAPIRADSPELP